MLAQPRVATALKRLGHPYDMIHLSLMNPRGARGLGAGRGRPGRGAGDRPPCKQTLSPPRPRPAAKHRRPAHPEPHSRASSRAPATHSRAAASPGGARGGEIARVVCRCRGRAWQDTPTPHISPCSRPPPPPWPPALDAHRLMIQGASTTWGNTARILRKQLTFSSSGSWSPKSDAMLDLLLGTSAAN